VRRFGGLADSVRRGEHHGTKCSRRGFASSGRDEGHIIMATKAAGVPGAVAWPVAMDQKSIFHQHSSMHSHYTVFRPQETNEEAFSVC